MSRNITIREINSISEISALESVQKQVWSWHDIDTIPSMMFVAMNEVGAILLGAYEEQNLVGFAFGFMGYADDQIMLHSHMLGVLPEYSGRGIGFRLKLAQRERALARGLTCITWSFDPLRSVNAHLNLTKLGVIASKYKVNLYGEKTSSALHRHIGTDRLWASWFLDSDRVTRRLRDDWKPSIPVDEVLKFPFLVEASSDNTPISRPLAPLHDYVAIEIPSDINLLQQHDFKLALAWRNCTRSAFTEALSQGYVVSEFYRIDRMGKYMTCYALSRNVTDQS